MGAAFALRRFSARAGFATRQLRKRAGDGAAVCDVGWASRAVVRGGADVCGASRCAAIRGAVHGSQSVRMDYGVGGAAGWFVWENEMERGGNGVDAKRALQIPVA